MTRVVHDLLFGAAGEVPDKPAVLHKDEKMTYGEIADGSRRLAGALVSWGVAKGDRVSFFLEKRLEKVVAIFGISAAGGVFVPIRRLSHAHQAAHIVHDSGSSLLITTYGRIPLLAECLKDMPGLRRIVAMGQPADANGVTLPGVEISDWSRALASADPGARLPHVVEPDLAAILYTSGSTGKPKGVVLSHLNIVAGARTVSEYLRITSDDRLLSILTFGFDYGLNQLTTCFLKRAQIVLLDYLFPKDIIAAARKYSITGIGAVATTWIQLLQTKWGQEDLPDLRYVTNSGGAIPVNLVKEIRARIPKVSLYLMYGLTEAFRSTFLDPALADEYPSSMGKAIPGEEILIVDPEGRPVAPGEVGELVHRGVLVAQGYWNAPELTAIRFRRNPMQPAEIPIPETVVFSGDQVRIDGKGFLYFVGRRDEMIKCAGNRISPTEVEELVYASGLVQAAMALGLPHEIYGQSVGLIAAPSEGSPADPDALLAYCKKNMPPYMVPHHVEMRDTLPRNANGKLDRALIKREVFEKLGITGK